MNESWYEQQGPATDEVRNNLLEIYISPNRKDNLVSLTTIKKVINDVILIEDTSDNNFILNVLMKRYITLFESTMSYYFYNYANIPFLSYEVLCIA